MPTVEQQITATPIDLVATLSLVANDFYSLQNVGNNDILFSEISVAPAEGNRAGNILRAGEWANIEIRAIPVYFWVINTPNGRLMVNDG